MLPVKLIVFIYLLIYTNESHHCIQKKQLHLIETKMLTVFSLALVTGAFEALFCVALK